MSYPHQQQQRPPMPPPPPPASAGGGNPQMQMQHSPGQQRPPPPRPPPPSSTSQQNWRPMPPAPSGGPPPPPPNSQSYQPRPATSQQMSPPLPNAHSPMQQMRPPYPPQQQQYQQQQQPANMANLSQQMGGMQIGQQQQQQQQQQQPAYSAAQSPPIGAPTARPPTRRVYPQPNLPPVSNAMSQGQMQGYPPSVSGHQMPQGYPSPNAAAPINTGPQTFVPGAQVPTSMPTGNRPGQPQPPHSPQYPQQQQQPQPVPYEPPKPRIDSNQLPSPIAVHAHNQEIHNKGPYSTAVCSEVPLSTTRFTAVDDGNCNPRFMRMTMYNVAHTEELVKQSHLPMGIVVQPLADLDPSEEPVKLIDFGEEGPIRCLRCKTYINPYMSFINGGKSFVCNMCRHENEVPDDYFCNLDMAGRRLDREMRPELHNGTVEFVATKDFIVRQPEPAAFVFAIDVTWSSIQSGMVAHAVTAIKAALYDSNGAGIPPGTKVGIITYDRSAHFYSLSPSLEQAQMMVVPDIQDVFIPISEGFVVDPEESRHIIEPLLDSLPSMFANNRTAEPVLGAVVQATHDALKGRGGKLFLFQTAMPTFGPGSLKQRDDPKLHNTPKENTLYEAQSPFYQEWGVKLVDEGISCSLYLFPATYMDVATLSRLSTVTGGELHSYAGFSGARDGKRFESDLRADAQRTYGSSGVLRIRTSDGLRVDEHYGNLYMRNHVDVELAGVTSDTSIAALLKYDEKLDEKQDAYFQAALLYTTSDGQRRIRVHNIATSSTTLIGNLFRSSEVDASMNLIAKMAVAEAENLPLRNIREKLADNCVQILTSYRRNHASGTPPGQLILPEAYKLSPIYNLALLKSPAIRGGADVPIDNRTAHMCMLRQMSVRKSADYLYPTIVPLHQFADEGSEDGQQELSVLPPLVRAAYNRLETTGAYMMSSGGSLMLWLGRQVPPQFVQEALGMPSLEQIDVNVHRLPELDTVLSKRIRAVVDLLLPSRIGFANVQIVRQGMDPAEIQFASLLVEDRNNDNMTYVDYVCAIHRQIQSEARPKGPVEPKWNYNYNHYSQ